MVSLVFDDGPALQESFAGGLLGHDETVAGLPHRGFDQIPETDLAFALAIEVEGYRFLVLVTRLGESLQGLGKLSLERGIADLQ